MNLGLYPWDESRLLSSANMLSKWKNSRPTWKDGVLTTVTKHMIFKQGELYLFSYNNIRARQAQVDILQTEPPFPYIIALILSGQLMVKHIPGTTGFWNVRARKQISREAYKEIGYKSNLLLLSLYSISPTEHSKFFGIQSRMDNKV